MSLSRLKKAIRLETFLKHSSRKKKQQAFICAICRRYLSFTDKRIHFSKSIICTSCLEVAVMDQTLQNLIDTICDTSTNLTLTKITEEYIYFANAQDMSFRFYIDNIINLMKNHNLDFYNANSKLMLEFLGG